MLSKLPGRMLWQGGVRLFSQVKEMGQEEMAPSYTRGGLNWVLGKKKILAEVVARPWKRLPRKVCSPHSWRDLRTCGCGTGDMGYGGSQMAFPTFMVPQLVYLGCSGVVVDGVQGLRTILRMLCPVKKH